jgi:hypothetical protein
VAEWRLDGVDTVAARRGVEYTPEQVFYAAACAIAERSGVEPRYVELFREGVDDPEAVDTLADRDPGFRVGAAGLLDPASYVAWLSSACGREHVWSQIVDQLPTGAVLVPIRGTVE